MDGVAAAWAAAYWVNGWLRVRVFHGLLEMGPGNRLTETLHFFFCDAVEIALLLSGIIFVITLLRSYMSIERALVHSWAVDVKALATCWPPGIGVATPFCSCSAVPAFIGFVAAGVPLGVPLSFLIASPLVNEIAIGLLLTLFGVKITWAYIGAGLLIAISAAWLLGHFELERYVESFVFEKTLGGKVIAPPPV